MTVEVTLRDGSRALLRPIEPEDAWRLREGMKLLSAQSRYQRFLSPVDHLTESQLRYLTEVDQHNHAAWVALDPDDPESPGMGVARYIRLKDEPTVAEAAVTVIDHHQGKGLGTILLTVLAETAKDNGIDTFRSYVLRGNDDILEIARQVGAEIEEEEGEGTAVVDVHLPDDVDELPDTPAGQAIRALARHTLTAREASPSP